MTSTWMRKMVAAAAVVAAASAGAVGAGAVGDANGGAPAPRSGAASPSESVFVPVTPCRIVNTQNPAGKLQAGETREYMTQGATGPQGGAATCGIPRTATAIEMTITAVSAEGPGYLRAGPAGKPTPTATFLSYGPGQNIGNTGTVAVTPSFGNNLRVQAFQAPTHVVIDVSGYYVKGLEATIQADGLWVRANGIVSSDREATGTYRVDFDRNISGCAYSVTVGNPVNGTSSPGMASATPNGLNPNGVFVQTFDKDGNPANRSFHLAVSC